MKEGKEKGGFWYREFPIPLDRSLFMCSFVFTIISIAVRAGLQGQEWTVWAYIVWGLTLFIAAWYLGGALYVGMKRRQNRE